MVEILAESLQQLFDNTSLSGKCTYSGELYEIWEISDEDFKTMCDMSEDDFLKVCPYGMWRSGDGSVLGIPSVKYVINNNEIIAWDGNTRNNYHRDYCMSCSDKYDSMCNAEEKDINECCGERKYCSLLEYLCDELGVSTPKNVCACVIDLAKVNNMKMSELFIKYEPDKKRQ